MEFRTNNIKLGKLAPYYGVTWEWRNVGPGFHWGPDETVILETADFEREIHFHDENTYDWVPPIREGDPDFEAWLRLIRENSGGD